LEEYQKSGIILNNLLMLSWIILGSLTGWYFRPLVAVLYFSFGVIVVYVMHPKLACPKCYYYDKWCGMGLGRLSALISKPSDSKYFNSFSGMLVIPLIFGILVLIPLAIYITWIFQEFNPIKIIIVVLWLSELVYGNGIVKKKKCSLCKMEITCPESALKLT